MEIISDELGADVPEDDDVLVPVASQARKSRVLCAHTEDRKPCLNTYLNSDLMRFAQIELNSIKQ